MPLLLLVLAGCGDDRGLVEVPVSAAPSEAVLALDDDVAITLDTASVTFSALRFEGHLHAAKRWSLVPTAYAHPGHGASGETAGELLGAWTVDLLGAPVSLGSAGIYEGSLETASIDVEEVRLAGTATVDGADVALDLVLEPDAPVAGVPFPVEVDADAPPSGITLSVDLAHALSAISWPRCDTDRDGVVTAEDDTDAAEGVASASTWVLTLDD